MKYYTIDHDMNRPMPNQINVPLNSEYGIGVRVLKDDQPIELGMDELSVNGMSAVTQVEGYNLYELSSGDIQSMKTLDVTASKGGEGETFENTVSAKQAVPNREQTITIQLGKFLEGTEIAPSNIAEFEMSSSLTPNAGGDPITETYIFDNKVQFYGRVSSDMPLLWWHIKDGKWTDQVESGFSDTIVLGVVGTRNVQVVSKKLYPQSTGTATYKLAFKFGEDFNAKFPIHVMEKDLGYFECRIENEDTKQF